MAGVTVDLIGSVNATTTTDGAGSYSFSGLPLSGDYRVSVSYPRYYFTPANRFYQGLVVNQTANFDVLGTCILGRCVRNGKLGYVRGGDVRVMNPDGTGDTNITNNPASITIRNSGRMAHSFSQPTVMAMTRSIGWLLSTIRRR
jgi:hypothetical protein